MATCVEPADHIYVSMAHVRVMNESFSDEHGHIGGVW